MASARESVWPQFGEGVRREGQAEWVYAMFHASRLLTFGSAMIFLASASVWLGFSPVGSGGILGLVIFTGLAVLFFLLGWVALHDASTRWSSTLLVFAVSVAGFAAGLMVALASVYPLEEFPRHLVWAMLGGYIVLPYQAIVFAPVVVAQAVLFLLTAPVARLRDARMAVAAGAVALVAVASAALAVSATDGFAIAGPGASLAGATVIGYALVAWGWWRSYGASGVELSTFWLRPRPLAGRPNRSEAIRRTPNDDSAIPKP